MADLHIIGASQKGVTINFSTDVSDHLYFNLDRYRLTQILNNLIGNAVKFTDKGRIDIELGVSENLEASISIEDTGLGMSKNTQKKIFKEFSQGDDSLKKSYEGTGLGLTISKALVEKMNGSISCTSKLGEGSRFVLQIPLSPASQPERFSETSENKSFQNLNCLLVDDNLINRTVIKKLVSSIFQEIKTVSSGKESVEELKNRAFDVVLMDCQMPEMDGYETTKLIRASTEIKQPFIIALTANVLPEFEKKCLDSGMDSFLTKPVNREQLKKLIGTRFKEIKSASQMRSKNAV